MDRKQTALRPYFEKMDDIGKPLSAGEVKRSAANVKFIQEQEDIINAAIEKVKNAGSSSESIRKRGWMTVWDRLEYLVDPGTWCPLHTLFNPNDNEEGCTGVIDGLGKIEGKWAVIIAFDNKVMAGAWISGQSENILRVTDMAKRLHIPLVWLTNCSGVKLMEQERVYANRRGSGTTFFRHAELNRLGIPVLNAIYGTNPAGGGYQGISPTILLAHKDCNIAVGGAGIVGGMNPKGYFDEESAQQLIDATRGFVAKPPGRVETHFDETAYFREVYDAETGVLDGIKDYMKGMPVFDPKVFRVAEPAEPKFPVEDLNMIVASNQKRAYDVIQFLARLTDNSEFMEYKPGYGPEVFTGIAKIDGFPVGFIGNVQGALLNYPEYANGAYMGIGGKQYRQGLIKQNEFVTLCGRDNLPIIWIQDTTGIDVGDIAERAELLALGQSLIYSIEQTDVAMMCIVLRKGSAAAHYIMGGPQANENNAFTLGTPLTEIYVMHGETAAAASYARRLVKEQDAGRDLGPTIEKMNQMVKDYNDKSRPVYCAQTGFVDEVVTLPDLRKYCVAFTCANYQNPKSITPIHQMILPRSIKG
ncbi:glutaconyl-CoA decarboxylase subunit alpha [Desulfosporosinus sp. Tol-M]|jgi:Acetyl-CoA carboxylase, carboxyltransferase component (subunits alpha and beta)|nr:glutaconyl-CoA decarboxylase subunit alpha [Desulfosporosinus sp. Tol-M]